MASISSLRMGLNKPKVKKTSLRRLEHLRRWFGWGSVLAVLLFYAISMLLVRQVAIQSLEYSQTNPSLGLGYPPVQLAEVKKLDFSFPDSSGLLVANLSELLLEQENVGQVIAEDIPQRYRIGNISAYYVVHRGNRWSADDSTLWLRYVDTSFTEQIVIISTVVVASVAFIAWMLISRACKDAQAAIAYEHEVAKHTFARASHELKTPLAVIQGCADGAADGMLDAQEAHDVITTEIVHATALANQALQCAMVEEGAVTPSVKEVPLPDLLEVMRTDCVPQDVKIDSTNLSPEAVQDLKILCDADFTEALLRALIEEAVFRALPVEAAVQVHETDVSLILAIQGEVPSQEGLGLGVDFARCLMKLQGGSLDYLKQNEETLITLVFNSSPSKKL